MSKKLLSFKTLSGPSSLQAAGFTGPKPFAFIALSVAGELLMP